MTILSCLTYMSSSANLTWTGDSSVAIAVLPAFTADGVLPPGDYSLTLDELRQSFLVKERPDAPNWDHRWRAGLVDNLEVLVRQLWQVGVDEIFIDGSF